MIYKCATCQKEVEGDLLVFIEHTDKHIIEAIKEKHPDWIQDDGLCPKCIEFFRRKSEHETFLINRLGK